MEIVNQLGHNIYLYRISVKTNLLFFTAMICQLNMLGCFPEIVMGIKFEKTYFHRNYVDESKLKCLVLAYFVVVLPQADHLY